MKRQLFFFICSLLIFSGSLASAYGQGDEGSSSSIELPSPRFEGSLSLERALFERESVRSFAESAVSLEYLGQLLWAGNGMQVDAISGPTRTAPSAGGLYPQELYVFSGNVEDLEPGVYRYEPDGHELIRLIDGDRRRELARASLNQRFISDAPATIVVGGVIERTRAKYGTRGAERYVYMDAAASAENIFLQATALGLATLTVGAFDDNRVSGLMGSESDVQPLFIMPIGYPK
jgi:SagB-type dehydrogenase family enzyme